MLLSADEDTQYTVKIRNARINLAKVELHQEVKDNFQAVFLREPCIYFMRGSRFKQYSALKGTTSLTLTDIFPTNLLPDLCIFFFCEEKALNVGTLTSNVHYHPHADVNRISLSVGGHNVTRTLDFSSSKYIETYLDFLKATEDSSIPRNIINYKSWSQGYSFFILNFQPEKAQGLVAEQLTGICNLQIQFASALEENKTLFLYSILPQQLAIHQDGTIVLSPDLQ